MRAAGAGVFCALVAALWGIGACGLAVGCSASGSNGGGAGDAAATDAAGADHSSGDTGTHFDSGSGDDASDAAAVDASNDTTPAPDGPACMLTMGGTGAPACDTCLTANCCDKFNNCFNDNGCLDLINCVAGCADAGDAGGCVSDCDQRDPGSVQTFNTFANCLAGPCKTPCGS